MDNEWICPICLDDNPEDCHVLPCNHRFHTRCIVEAFRRGGPNCPYCRALPDNYNEAPFVQNQDNQQNIQLIINEIPQNQNNIQLINNQPIYDIANNLVNDMINNNINNINNLRNNIIHNINYFQNNQIREYVLNNIRNRINLNIDQRNMFINNINHEINNIQQ